MNRPTLTQIHDKHFYCRDRDFGPFFLKFCSYFPYSAKLCLNGHEYLKCQLAQRGIAFQALDNGLLACAEAFEQLQQPAEVDGQHASALPFGQARVQALLAAVVLFCLQPEGFRNRQLRPLLAQLLGVAESDITPGRMRCDLRRLRLHGLLERIPKSHRYRLTTFGLKTALFYSRTYQRLLRRGLSELHDPRLAQTSTLAANFARFQTALDTYTTEILAA